VPFSGTVKLPSYPTREYLGLIFAYFGEGDPPAFPRYPEFEAEGVLEADTYTRACNYFNNVENGADLFHVAWAHRGGPAREHSIDYIPGAITVQESDWGLTAFVRLADGNIRTNQLGMPNILHFKSHGARPGEWGDVFGWRVPIDDHHHNSFGISIYHVTGERADEIRQQRIKQPRKDPERANRMTQAVLRGEVRLIDVDEPRNFLVNVQDDVTQVGQGAIAPRAQERRGATDAGVVLWRQIWERELRALAHGGPLKQWVRSGDLAATSGA
jgi:5,5'-dehydrodivanillate O-demethylase